MGFSYWCECMNETKAGQGWFGVQPMPYQCCQTQCTMRLRGHAFQRLHDILVRFIHADVRWMLLYPRKRPPLPTLASCQKCSPAACTPTLACMCASLDNTTNQTLSSNAKVMHTHHLSHRTGQ
jgi:hypothetical protein